MNLRLEDGNSIKISESVVEVDFRLIEGIVTDIFSESHPSINQSQKRKNPSRTSNVKHGKIRYLWN